MTLPSSASSTSSGTSKATIVPGGSTQYLNIPLGYNSAAAYYTIPNRAALGLGDTFTIEDTDQQEYVFTISHDGQAMNINPTEFANIDISNEEGTRYAHVISSGILTNVVCDISTANNMDSALTAANSGIYFRYTGTTGTSSSGNYYVNGNLYKYE